MRRWRRRVRAALLTGLTWAVPWAAAAVALSFVVDPDGSMDEPWLLVGAYPGFVGGVLFAVVLGIAARRRRFEELSMARVAGWGAAAGFAVGVLPFLVGEPAPGTSVLLLGGVVITAFTVMSAASAAGSLALARRAERRALVDGPGERGLVGGQGERGLGAGSMAVSDPIPVPNSVSTVVKDPRA